MPAGRRLIKQAMSDASEALPLTILTGFLGAGKTTCLNAVLAARDATGIAVLVNEFGEAPIDGMLLPQAASGRSLVELSNGCICCTIRQDLVDALLELARFRRASPERARQAVLETTGLADPGAILSSIMMSAALRAEVRVARIVSVCDTPRLAELRARFVEVDRQLGAADDILLNKLEGVSRPMLADAGAMAAALNPLAAVHAIDAATLDPALLLGPWPEAPVRVTAPASPFGGHARPSPGFHATGGAARSFTVRLAAPLDHDRLRDALSFLVLRHAEKLLRCKGIFRVAGEAHPIVLQGMQDVVRTTRAPDHTRLDADDHGLIVFIGIDLPEATIRADLTRCSVSPGG